jgi:hypothetical protein
MSHCERKMFARLALRTFVNSLPLLLLLLPL